MQTANIMLAIGGDRGNTIPKMGVTAAEIPVLMAIHGEAAVHDIEPIGEIARSNREELGRLRGVYGKIRDGKDVSPVETLYPGAAARVFETIDDLQIPEEFFKAEKRVSAKAPAYAENTDETRPMTVPIASVAPAPIEEPDGIGEMTDTNRIFG